MGTKMPDLNEVKTDIKSDAQLSRDIRNQLLEITAEMCRMQKRGLRVNFTVASPNGSPTLVAFEVVKLVEL